MNQKAYNVVSLPDVITIGRKTETGVLAVHFDCTAWLAYWPKLSLSLWVTPPNGSAAYPAKTYMSGKELVWLVDSGDTAVEGKGTLEIVGVASGQRKLSTVVKTQILPTSTASTSEPPTAAKSWYDKLLDMIKELEKGSVSDDQIESAINKYLAENPIEAVDIDSTLTKSGTAADAKAVGDALKNKLGQSDLSTAVDNALTQAKNSGDFDGADGYSPTVSLTRFDGGVTITVTTKDGTKTATVYDGVGGGSGEGGTGSGADGGYYIPSVSENGDLNWTPTKGDMSPVETVNIKGDKGDTGDPGVSCTHSWNGTVLSITSESGTSSADLKGDKGDKGDTGDPGSPGSPGTPCTHSWNGTTLSITSASGTTSADLKGEKGDTGEFNTESIKDIAYSFFDLTGSIGLPTIPEDGSTVTSNGLGMTYATLREYIDSILIPGFKVNVQHGDEVVSVTTHSFYQFVNEGDHQFDTICAIGSDYVIIHIEIDQKNIYARQNAIAKMSEVNALIEDIELTPGPKGDTGDPGYTPVKGTDYWTDADKAAMVSDVLNAMTNANGVSF